MSLLFVKNFHRPKEPIREDAHGLIFVSTEESPSADMWTAVTGDASTTVCASGDEWVLILLPCAPQDTMFPPLSNSKIL